MGAVAEAAEEVVVGVARVAVGETKITLEEGINRVMAAAQFATNTIKVDLLLMEDQWGIIKWVEDMDLGTVVGTVTWVEIWAGTWVGGDTKRRWKR